MKKFVIIFIIFIFSGCSTTNKTFPEMKGEGDVVMREVKPDEPTRELWEIQTIQRGKPSLSEPASIIEAVQQKVMEQEPQEVEAKQGVVFAKTDFGGLLKASYVRLLIEKQVEGQERGAGKLQLHIGEPASENKLPWDVKAVEPGYFFIELPVGQYKITSVSIPVGSTLAVEAVDIDWEVVADEIGYLGTLKMVGTKDKIKLGGVPVIKPGFEYTVEVLDETQEGTETFKARYPDISNSIVTRLMAVHSENN